MENSKNHKNGISQEVKNNEPWWQPSLILFTKLSGWIGIPVIVALFFGNWLDDKYGTEPWLFLLSVMISFLVSSIGMVKESSAAMKKISEECEREKRGSSNDRKDYFK